MANTAQPPYAIQVSDDLSTSTSATLMPEQYARRVVVASRLNDSLSFASFEMPAMSIKLTNGTSVPLNFVEVSDSLSTRNNEAVWNALASEVVMLPATLDSVILDVTAAMQNQRRILGNGEVGVRLQFEIIDGRNGRAIANLGSERLFSASGRSRFRIAERLRTLAGREVAIRPVVRALARGREDMRFTLVHVHRVESGSNASALVLKSARQPEIGSAARPTVFTLHPSYPNPFNPSTTIKFDLPEPSQVSLVIYDVLGRKVAELENGMKEAGYHSATWNASDVASGVSSKGGYASGVYFARFSPTDANGNLRLSKVNKLLLAK
jgi:hypothetical protein